MNRTYGAMGAGYAQAPLSEDVVWQLKGLCNQYDPDEFQPATELDARFPKQICADCPVMVKCREWALDKHEISGVWGGMSEEDRIYIWTGRRTRHRNPKSA